MKEKETLAYQTPVLTVTEVSLEQGIAATSTRFKEGDNVIKEQDWEVYDDATGGGQNVDYDFFI